MDNEKMLGWLLVEMESGIGFRSIRKFCGIGNQNKFCKSVSVKNDQFQNLA